MKKISLLFLLSIISIVSYGQNKLKENNEWQENETSLILEPDRINENIEERKLKKKSLELVGWCRFYVGFILYLALYL